MTKIAAIMRISDPARRARAAGDAIAQLQAELEQLKELRHQAVLELRAGGMSHAGVANVLGISRGRAQQIAEGRPQGKRARVD